MPRPRSLPAGFIAPSLTTKTDKLPSGDLWLHDTKHDGFPVIARKDGDRVRLYSRPGNDLTYRFPTIAAVELRKSLDHQRRQCQRAHRQRRPLVEPLQFDMLRHGVDLLALGLRFATSSLAA